MTLISPRNDSNHRGDFIKKCLKISSKGDFSLINLGYGNLSQIQKAPLLIQIKNANLRS
jgi:hypothetical protein